MSITVAIFKFADLASLAKTPIQNKTIRCEIKIKQVGLTSGKLGSILSVPEIVTMEEIVFLMGCPLPRRRCSKIWIHSKNGGENEVDKLYGININKCKTKQRKYKATNEMSK